MSNPAMIDDWSTFHLSEINFQSGETLVVLADSNQVCFQYIIIYESLALKASLQIFRFVRFWNLENTSILLQIPRRLATNLVSSDWPSEPGVAY